MSLDKLERICKSVFNSRKLNSKSRKRENVDARKAFSIIAYYNELGDVDIIMNYVGRDRTTFNHYQKEVTRLIKFNKDFKTKFEFCKKSYEARETSSEINFHLEMITYHQEKIKKIKICED